MTEPVTHMCWSEQISPLAHSSQATWQLFNLGHCLEMHNTHLLGHAGQLSQTYFTHLAPILTSISLDCQQQWPPLRESRMSRHTRFSTSRKTESAVMYGLFLGTNTAYRSTIPSNQSDFVFLLYRKCRNHSYLKCDSRICNPETHTTLVKPVAHFCLLSKCDVVWMISVRKASYVALRNVQFDSFVTWLLKFNVACCDLTLVRCRCVYRDPGNVSTTIYLYYRSTYCLGAVNAKMWVCNPASRDSWPSRESAR